MASDSEETLSRRPARNVGMTDRCSDYDLSGGLQLNDDECPTSPVGDSAFRLATTSKQILHVTFRALEKKKNERIEKIKPLKANKTFRDRANKAEKNIVSQIFKKTDSDNSQPDSEGEIMCNQQNMLTLKYNNFKVQMTKFYISVSSLQL